MGCGGGGLSSAKSIARNSACVICSPLKNSNLVKLQSRESSVFTLSPLSLVEHKQCPNRSEA